MDKLLLIDDEADVQYSFRRIFDSPEIELTAASSGEEGFKLIPKLKPDLVIMDVRMGGMNGLETLRRIRETNAKLPVIMMTAYGTTQLAIHAMKVGGCDLPSQPPERPVVARDQLRSHPGEPLGERTFRTRERRVHRREQPADRQIRTMRPGHYFSG